MGANKSEMTAMINVLNHVVGDDPIKADDFSSDELKEMFVELGAKVLSIKWKMDPIEEFCEFLADDFNEDQIKYFRRALRVHDTGTAWVVRFPLEYYNSNKADCQKVLSTIKKVFMDKNHWVNWPQRQAPSFNKFPRKNK